MPTKEFWQNLIFGLIAFIGGIFLFSINTGWKRLSCVLIILLGFFNLWMAYSRIRNPQIWNVITKKDSDSTKLQEDNKNDTRANIQ